MQRWLLIIIILLRPLFVRSTTAFGLKKDGRDTILGHTLNRMGLEITGVNLCMNTTVTYRDYTGGVGWKRTRRSLIALVVDML